MKLFTFILQKAWFPIICYIAIIWAISHDWIILKNSIASICLLGSILIGSMIGISINLYKEWNKGL